MNQIVNQDTKEFSFQGERGYVTSGRLVACTCGKKFLVDAVSWSPPRPADGHRVLPGVRGVERGVPPRPRPGRGGDRRVGGRGLNLHRGDPMQDENEEVYLDDATAVETLGELDAELLAAEDEP